MKKESEDHQKTAIFTDNEIIDSIIINSKIISDHGAACYIRINPSTKITDENKKIFWIVLHKATDELNASHDSAHKNRIENGSSHFEIGNDGIKHTLAGGETATIDNIKAENIDNVVAKLLRLLRHQKAISEDELKHAYNQLALPKATLVYQSTSANRALAGYGV